MKFKTDENLPVEAAEDLRQAGHDAVTAADQLLAGQTDVRVAEACRVEGRALLTLDLDFSDLRSSGARPASAGWVMAGSGRVDTPGKLGKDAPVLGRKHLNGEDLSG